LAKDKGVWGPEALLGHHGGSAENHDQANEDEQQRRGKQRFVDTNSFGHKE
jgi:hypothetical protein